MKIERKTVIRILLTILVLIISGNLVVLTVLPLKEFTVSIFLSNVAYSLLIGGSMAIGITQISSWLDRKHPWLGNPLKRLVLQISLSIGFCLLVIFIVVMVMIFLNHDASFSTFFFESGLFMVKTAIIILPLSMLITYSITFFINWKSRWLCRSS
jgi:hypothetical protein